VFLAPTRFKMFKVYLFTFLSLFACNSFAGGLLGVDHMLNKDENGIWSRNNQMLLEYGSAAIVVGGALWEGNETRLGKTFWKATDSMVMADVAANGAKLVFRRQRPNTSGDPNAWFKTTSDKSFPSGEVAHISAIVTPFIAEYAQDTPGIWALALLPVYDGIARMKSQAHWQSDVLAGAALGVATGLYANNRSDSWLVHALPGGFSIGYKKSFD
jgi:membrane-associated phospholipid phosphatase